MATKVKVAISQNSEGAECAVVLVARETERGDQPSFSAKDSGSHKVHPLCEKQPRTGGYPADKIKSFP